MSAICTSSRDDNLGRCGGIKRAANFKNESLARSGGFELKCASEIGA